MKLNDPVEFARKFATALHADNNQLYGGHPYDVHLGDVVAVLTSYGLWTDQELMAAAWLHDTVEDTALTLNAVDSLFGPQVANLVWSVTNEHGVNRRERHAKTYPKIKLDSRAVALKLADRIANTGFSILNQSSQQDMYRKEYPGFRAALHTLGQHAAMWEQLDALYARLCADN
jgi:(p)ppGpp synthase/HD superfamily hydrolase